MSPSPSTLFYVADPMCSWCWGFRPVLEKATALLPAHVPLRYVMGGLAPDTDEPMPEGKRDYVQGQWRAVEEQTGAEFNWDFWTRCRPRRATYPACRAVLAAAAMDPKAGPAMFHRIQRAFYTEARNPSDADTLIALAAELSLDATEFAELLAASATEEKLQADFALRRNLGANRFPGLILECGSVRTRITDGYSDAEKVPEKLTAALAAKKILP